MVSNCEGSSRREWISRVLLQTAAGASLLRGGTWLEAEQAPANADWRPTFLSEAQDRSVAALAERIVPGSAAANCDRVMDLVLSIETPEVQQEFKNALGAFEKQARSHFGTDLSGTAAAQIDELLVSASSPDAPLSAPFGLIKEWVADAYWSSQQGMRELGWKGRVAWGGFDGCPHAGSHSST